MVIIKTTAIITNKIFQQKGQFIMDDKMFVTVLNSVGNIVATANYGDNGIGIVKIFKYNENENNWNQLGQTIYGEEVKEKHGISISINASGDIIAVASLFFNIPSENGSSVTVYKYNDSEDVWIPYGEPIEGEKIDANILSSSVITVHVELNGEGEYICNCGNIICSRY